MDSISVWHIRIQNIFCFRFFSVFHWSVIIIWRNQNRNPGYWLQIDLIKLFLLDSHDDGNHSLEKNVTWSTTTTTTKKKSLNDFSLPIGNLAEKKKINKKTLFVIFFNFVFSCSNHLDNWWWWLWEKSRGLQTTKIKMSSP